MPDHAELIAALQGTLDAVASPKTKEWWESYLRHAITFRGVGIPQIREQVGLWRAERGIADWPPEDQLELALALFESSIAEDKLAGILYLQNYLYDKFPWPELLSRYEQLFARGLIFDWNTCDWFCVRVLGPTIEAQGMPCAEAIAAWRNASDLWQARSSVVAFVPVDSDARYYPLLFESMAVLIRREERFAKTAVGWLLRDMSKVDPGAVLRFVDVHLPHFSSEAVRNALKYFPKPEQKSYLKRLKEAP